MEGGIPENRIIADKILEDKILVGNIPEGKKFSSVLWDFINKYFLHPTIWLPRFLLVLLLHLLSCTCLLTESAVSVSDEMNETTTQHECFVVTLTYSLHSCLVQLC